MAQIRKRKLSKKTDCLKMMPPHFNKNPGEDYSFEKSGVKQWIASQEDLIEWVFQVAKEQRLIIYDSESGTWQGVDYSDD